jgi:hypothetical protein
MTARQVVVGCSVTAVLVLAAVFVSGFLLFRHLSSPAPLPAPTTLVADDSVGLALLRIEADNAWLTEAFAHLPGRTSAPRPNLSKMAPLQVVWTARHAPPASEGHLVAMTLMPAGRFLGFTLDIALWKAGRGGEPLVRRVVHGGEGITSFPGAGIPGQFFVSGPTIGWGSDLDAARRGVDLLAAGAGGLPPVSGLPVLDLYPGSGNHVLRGALLEQDGCLARLLTSIPGAPTAPPDLAGVRGLSFTLDPSGGTEGVGEIRLEYTAAVSPVQRAQIASELAGWLQTVSPAGVRLQAAPREESPGEALALTVSDLDGMFDTLVRAVARAERAMKRAGAVEGPPDDQSSSTFQ